MRRPVSCVLPAAVLIAAVLIAAVLIAAGCSGHSAPGTGAASVTGPTNAVVWPAPATGVTARAQAAGLQILSAEAFVEHIHAHLDVFVNGQAVTVPANIGIDYLSGTITPLHTHDDSGVMHIESPDLRSFNLGQFFTEWGVKLGGGCLDTYCAPAAPVTVYVNGAISTADPAAVLIHAHDEIAIVAGAAPTDVPSQYRFPLGY